MFDPPTVSLLDIMASHGRWRGDWPAVVTPRETLGWRELERRTSRVANKLISEGARRGDRLALLMSNGLPMVELIFGIMKAGCIVVPLNPSSNEANIAAMLDDAGVRFVFATADHMAKLRPAAGVELVAVSTETQPVDAGWKDYGSWLAAVDEMEFDVAIAPTDLCNIIYSSGTTGEPKGIAHTHEARLFWAQDLALAQRYHSGARALVATGLCSNISWGVMLCTFLVGGTIFLRDGFDAADVIATISRERITHVGMVPIQYQRMLQHPSFDAADRSSVQSLMSVGSALPEATKTRLFETFPSGIFDVYGLTEGIITTHAIEEVAGRIRSVGRPLPGSDIRILGDDDRPVPVGEIGEVVGRSRFVMAGYWRKPQATADAMWVDEKGRYWLRSGDIGRLDEQGYLYIVDRKKDMILSGAQNVYPADLEAVLFQHPDVLDCAVIGVPSETWGESPLALVVPRPDARAGVDAGALLRWLNERVGKRQRVMAVEIRRELPRNAAGKLLKRDLRAPYWTAA